MEEERKKKGKKGEKGGIAEKRKKVVGRRQVDAKIKAKYQYSSENKMLKGKMERRKA